MESGIDPEDQDHAEVTQHGDGVDGQEYQNLGHPEVEVLGEAQEDESDFNSLICLGSMGERKTLYKERRSNICNIEEKETLKFQISFEEICKKFQFFLLTLFQELMLTSVTQSFFLVSKVTAKSRKE